MIPSPTDLMYFLDVANLLNLSRAAESLGISQPSLTLAMRRLEECVGTEVITRHKRGVTLTKAGKQLLAHTRLLLQQWDMIKSETLASQNEIQGCFTIGCHTSVGIFALPRFLPDLLEKNPMLEIKLKHDISRKITEKVINLSVDVGIVVNPVRHPDVVIKRLDTDRMTLWHSQTERDINNFVSGRAHIICDPELLQVQMILKKLKQQGIHYKHLIATTSLELIADMTNSGCGIGILPAHIAATRNLIRIAKAPYHDDEVCLIYRGENRNVKGIQTITDAIKAGFKK